MQPSRLVAAFRITNGRPLAHQREERLVQRDGAARRRGRPRRRRRARAGTRSRGRAPSGFGSSTAATTRAMPASTMRLTHGPVRPSGSTARACSTASRRARARRPSSSACTSACGSPARSWKPCPTTTPSADTTTAPTSGFGLVRPRPRAAETARGPWNHASASMSVGARVTSPLLLEQAVDVLVAPRTARDRRCLRRRRRSGSAASDRGRSPPRRRPSPCHRAWSARCR